MELLDYTFSLRRSGVLICWIKKQKCLVCAGSLYFFFFFFFLDTFSLSLSFSLLFAPSWYFTLNQCWRLLDSILWLGFMMSAELGV